MCKGSTIARVLHCSSQVLPPGWYELHDFVTGRTYYANPETGASRWEPPVTETWEDFQKRLEELAVHIWLYDLWLYKRGRAIVLKSFRGTPRCMSKVYMYVVI